MRRTFRHAHHLRTARRAPRSDPRDRSRHVPDGRIESRGRGRPDLPEPVHARTGSGTGDPLLRPRLQGPPRRRQDPRPDRAAGHCRTAAQGGRWLPAGTQRARSRRRPRVRQLRGKAHPDHDAVEAADLRLPAQRRRGRLGRWVGHLQPQDRLTLLQGHPHRVAPGAEDHPIAGVLRRAEAVRGATGAGAARAGEPAPALDADVERDGDGLHGRSPTHRSGHERRPAGHPRE